MGRFIRFVAGFATLVALMVLPACSPRPPWWIGGDPDAPMVSSVALTRMEAALGMSDEQRKGAGDLHAAYVAQHQQAAAKYRDWCRLADAMLERKQKDPEVLARKDQGTVKYAAHAERLAQQFLDDLRLLLTTEQSSKWEDAMRALRRSQMLGPVYEEKTADLLAVVDGPPPLLSPEQRGKLKSQLDDWEQAMDAVLQRKAAFIRGHMAENLRAISGEDGAATKALYRDWRAIVREERVLCVRSSRALADALPEEVALKLRRKVSQQAYPWLYEKTPAEEPVRKALELPGLPASTKSRLESLLKEIEHEHLRLADQAARAFEEWEQTAKPDELAAKGNNPDPPPDLIKGYEKLEDRVSTALSEALTQEQLTEVGARRKVQSLPNLEFE